jgi:hypothetical protein
MLRPPVGQAGQQLRQNVGYSHLGEVVKDQNKCPTKSQKINSNINFNAKLLQKKIIFTKNLAILSYNIS